MALGKFSPSLLVPKKWVYNGPTGHAVYAIVNNLTGERYIGATSEVSWRWRQHLAHLRRGTHHARRLQEAWNAYGAHAFSFVLLECPEDDNQLWKIEQRYIDEYAPTYNTLSKVSRG